MQNGGEVPSPSDLEPADGNVLNFLLLLLGLNYFKNWVEDQLEA